MTSIKKYILIVVLLMSSQVAQAQKPHPVGKILEVFQTKAGELKLIKVDDKFIGETNFLIILGRKTIYATQDDVFGSVSFHTLFKAISTSDVVLVKETFTPGGCSQFRLLKLESNKTFTLSDRFGNCSDVPIITQQGDKITFDFSDDNHSKSATYVYRNGKLNKS